MFLAFSKTFAYRCDSECFIYFPVKRMSSSKKYIDLDNETHIVLLLEEFYNDDSSCNVDVNDGSNTDAEYEVEIIV